MPKLPPNKDTLFGCVLIGDSYPRLVAQSYAVVGTERGMVKITFVYNEELSIVHLTAKEAEEHAQNILSAVVHLRGAKDATAKE